MKTINHNMIALQDNWLDSVLGGSFLVIPAAATAARKVGIAVKSFAKFVTSHLDS